MSGYCLCNVMVMMKLESVKRRLFQEMRRNQSRKFGNATTISHLDVTFRLRHFRFEIDAPFLTLSVLPVQSAELVFETGDWTNRQLLLSSRT